MPESCRSSRTHIRVSAAAQRIKPSAANAASQRARELKAQGRDIIDLTTGEPDFPTPRHVCEAAYRAMLAGQTRYTAVDGTLELKQAIARKFARDNGLAYAPHEISVGTGAKQVIFNALIATLDPGDEVVIPLPCWVSYTEMVNLTGAVAVTVAACSDFDSLLHGIEAAITERTRWLLFNSPNNPSGTFFNEEELRALGAMLLRHPNVLILSDDIYEHILFDGRTFNTLAAVEPRLKDRTLTVNGVSKAYAMTGWRIGYAGGPAELIRTMAKIQSQSTSAASSVSQAAALAALEGPQDSVYERTAILQQRRDMLLQEFASIEGMTPGIPDGAFYLFLDCQTLIGRKTPDDALIHNDLDLVAYYLNAADVALVHGAPFGAPNHLRLSFAAGEDKLLKACARLRQACGNLV